MRNFKSYISLLAIGAAVLTACQNDFDNIDVPVPVATIQANTTINEVKTRYWNDATNYIDTIRLNDAGEHVVISGRVISSDASGNIYKSLVIQDATGAMAMSINANSMYQKYRMGQEVVVDLTDMFIGKYNGLQQLGFPEEYQDTYEATFMPYEFFEMHAQLNGLPEPAKVDTILVNSTADLSTSPEGLRKWQSQLVRFNNCHFEQGGQVAFTDGHKVTSNRNLILSDGNSIIVRTSGYSNFWSDMLPAGNGDVVGILSYFGTSGWQLLLNDRKGCMNFGNPTIGPGAEDNPYTVTEAIGIEQAGTSAKGWVTGYIVGAVAPGVTTVSSNDDIEFKADVTMDNTLVIAADPECKDFSQCLVFELPQDSKLRQYGNLVTNPSNYKKQMSLIGNLDKVYATYGVTGNNGTAAEFKIEGVEVPGDQPAEEGNGTEFTFTSAQFSSFTLPGSSTADGFTFDIEKANGSTAPAYHANTTAIRLYADNTMAISGKKMNKIVFTLASDAKFRYTTLTPSTGKINPAQTADDTEITWEGSASEVTFTVGHDATLGSDGPEKRGQVRFTAIKIWAE